MDHLTSVPTPYRVLAALAVVVALIGNAHGDPRKVYTPPPKYPSVRINVKRADSPVEWSVSVEDDKVIVRDAKTHAVLGPADIKVRARLTRDKRGIEVASGIRSRLEVGESITVVVPPNHAVTLSTDGQSTQVASLDGEVLGVCYYYVIVRKRMKLLPFKRKERVAVGIAYEMRAGSAMAFGHTQSGRTLRSAEGEVVCIRGDGTRLVLSQGDAIDPRWNGWSLDLAVTAGDGVLVIYPDGQQKRLRVGQTLPGPTL